METHFENMEQSQGESHIARERVLADLRTLARDSEELLRITAGDMSEKAKEVRARLTVALERARVTAHELQESTLAAARKAAKKADVVIREHPYESIGTAFGIGLLIGVLIGRR